jgi:predicted secreted hydrolase
MMLKFVSGIAGLSNGGLMAQPLKTEEGFAIPQPGRQFIFPRDHGSHPEFKIEWWYVTGHLFARKDGRRLGFQATWFRQAVKHAGPEHALFQHGQMYLAHMALLDVKNGRFLHEERLNRGGWNAGASVEILDVFNGNWFLRMEDAATQKMGLRGTLKEQATMDLKLLPKKPLVFFGRDGVSRKAAAVSASSHYLTFTRLGVEGVVELEGERLEVSGEAWMDHEISSSQLTPEQSGWDWASIQLNDGREIMVYRLRLKDGGVDAHSTLAWIDEKGAVEHRGTDAYQWREAGHWESPATGAKYPVEVEIRTVDPTTGSPVSYRLAPLLRAQEQTGKLGGTAYWEGACQVLDGDGKEVGSAFLELAGYTGDLAKRFE